MRLTPNLKEHTRLSWHTMWEPLLLFTFLSSYSCNNLWCAVSLPRRPSFDHDENCLALHRPYSSRDSGEFSWPHVVSTIHFLLTRNCQKTLQKIPTSCLPFVVLFSNSSLCHCCIVLHYSGILYYGNNNDDDDDGVWLSSDRIEEREKWLKRSRDSSKEADILVSGVAQYSVIKKLLFSFLL